MCCNIFQSLVYGGKEVFLSKELDENPFFVRLSVHDKAIARNDGFLASFDTVVREINVERPPKNMLDWFLKFLFEARYTNLPKSTWCELAKKVSRKHQCEEGPRCPHGDAGKRSCWFCFCKESWPDCRQGTETTISF